MSGSGPFSDFGAILNDFRFTQKGLNRSRGSLLPLATEPTR
jgi:hypothetical protein